MSKEDSKKYSQILREFPDNMTAKILFGEFNVHIKKLEDIFDVLIAERGNRIKIKGLAENVERVDAIFGALIERFKKENEINADDLDDLIRVASSKSTSGYEDHLGEFETKKISIKTYKKIIHPKSENQQKYLKALKEKDVVFSLGPAGTGKTYLSVAYAVSQLREGLVDRIVLTRPVVEAGENLGFLPGDLKEKIDPYIRPIYDALHDMMPAEQVFKRMELGDIEIAPLAYMRGRSLNNAFVILDEAQNTIMVQMKMFLTRLGQGSKMAINGDVTQVDLPKKTESGLVHAEKILKGISEIAFANFDQNDVVRHSIVSKIIRAYDDYP